MISNKSSVEIVVIKGTFSSLGSLIVALLTMAGDTTQLQHTHRHSHLHLHGADSEDHRHKHMLKDHQHSHTTIPSEGSERNMI